MNTVTRVKPASNETETAAGRQHFARLREQTTNLSPVDDDNDNDDVGWVEEPWAGCFDSSAIIGSASVRSISNCTSVKEIVLRQDQEQIEESGALRLTNYRDRERGCLEEACKGKKARTLDGTKKAGKFFRSRQEQQV